MADRVSATSGQLVKTEATGGGLDGPRSLVLITVREGTDDAVSADAIAAVAGAGYPAVAVRAPCTTGSRSCLLRAAGLPSVGIETFPAGAAVRGTTTVVPAGNTGVVTTLTHHDS